MAKRVKWESEMGSLDEIAVLGNGCYHISLVVNMPHPHWEDMWRTFSCRTEKARFFKCSMSAKRHAIREALKLHKLVGTQLTQLESDSK